MADQGATSEIRAVFGGKRGFLESSIPAIVFVVINGWKHDLTAAVIAAVATGGVLLVARLVRNETVKHAVGGFLGVVVAAFFARATGRAENFFLPGILINIGYGVVLLGSLALPQSAVEFMFRNLTKHPAEWYDRPGVRPAFRVVTLAWGSLFATRAVVQSLLWAAHRPGWLAVVRLIGAGAFALLAVWTLPFLERRLNEPAPEVT